MLERQSDCEILQKLQNAACRIILGCDSMTPINDLHNLTQLETLQAKRLRHTAHEMFKIFHKISPSSLQNMFILPGMVHQRNTRFVNTCNYVIPRCRLQQTHKSFRYRGVICWANVPLELKILPDIAEFKQQLYLEHIFV